jgi:hypothetical protein
MNREGNVAPAGRSNERGMALFSALIILAAVSLLAVGLTGDNATSLRIAGNRKVQQQTFELADGGANLGVQVLLDHLYPDLADPATDYPDPDATVALVPGELSLTHFHRDPNLLKDIQGYEGNDNADDPENGAADISFDLHPTPDAGLPYAEATQTVDIDRLRASYLSGSSIEFAAGYEGVGKGAAAGSVAVVYQIRSIASPSASASVAPEVDVVYRKVSQVIGGGK